MTHDLRERLTLIEQIDTLIIEELHEYYPGKHLAETIANAVQSLLAAQSPTIRCRDCGGTLIWERTPEGYEVIHSCERDAKITAELRKALEWAMTYADANKPDPAIYITAWEMWKRNSDKAHALFAQEAAK